MAALIARERILPGGRALASWLVAISTLLMSILSVVGWAPFDDEITSIRIAQNHDIASIARIVTAEDVHPPDSYILDKALYESLGSWDAVKLTAGALNALSLSLFIWLAYSKIAPAQRAALIFILATASTAVMWGASVRWYAYFNPVFVATLGILAFSDIDRTARAIVLGVSAVLLFYLSYAALCAIPVLAAVHIAREVRQMTARDWLVLAGVGLVAALACVPQLSSFIHIQSRRQAGQVGSPAQAFVQTVMTLILGNAVFPIAPLPIVYGLVVVAAVFRLLIRRRISHLDWIACSAVATGLVCMIVTGIGVKPRNSVHLMPLAAIVIASAIGSLNRLPNRIAWVVLVLFQGAGVWNVIAHEDTLKGSYNTDFRSVVRHVQAWNGRCGQLVVFNHDLVLAYLLEQAGLPQSSAYQESSDTEIPIVRDQCIAVVKTYRGVLSPTTIAKLYGTVAGDSFTALASYDVGPDGHRKAKEWVAHEPFPTHYAHVQILQARRNLSIPAWFGLAQIRPDRSASGT